MLSYIVKCAGNHELPYTAVLGSASKEPWWPCRTTPEGLPPNRCGKHLQASSTKANNGLGSHWRPSETGSGADSSITHFHGSAGVSNVDDRLSTERHLIGACIQYECNTVCMVRLRTHVFAFAKVK